MAERSLADQRFTGLVGIVWANNEMRAVEPEVLAHPPALHHEWVNRNDGLIGSRGIERRNGDTVRCGLAKNTQNDQFLALNPFSLPLSLYNHLVYMYAFQSSRSEC